MKSPRFDYTKPATLPEVFDLLARGIRGAGG